jgi:hypothetical protein
LADQKISELVAITGANTADDDVLVIVDTSATQTKKITLGELENALAERDFSFGDNDKLTFGAGSDLQIYHDGSNSYISEVGTGDLYVRGSNFYITKPDGSLYFSGSNSTGEAGVYFNNSKKLATTSTGVDITGTLTSDGLTVGSGTANQVATFSSTDAGAFLYIQDNNALGYYHGSSAGSYVIRDTDNKNRINIANNGDISFYEDTGTTAKFFWDASAESLGIGTSSPATTVEINGDTGLSVHPTSASTTGVLQIAGTRSSGASAVAVTNIKAIPEDPAANSDASSLAFETRSSAGTVAERMRIDSSGNVGIGTSSPSSALHVSGSGAEEIRITRTGGAGRSYSTSVGGSLEYNIRDEDAGVNRLSISTAGNVGIGTSSPDVNLHIKGNDGLVIEDDGTTNFFRIQTSNSGDAVFYTGSGGTPTERMRIDSSGNVGIGTSSPATTLDVNGSAYIRAGSILGLYNTDNTNQYQIYNGGSSGANIGQLVFTQGGVAERMRIDSSGNVGIGAASPSSTFRTSIYGDGSSIIGGVEFRNAAAGGATFTIGHASATSPSATLNVTTAANLTFNTDDTERMRIDSSGNLLVGKTTNNTLGVVGGNFSADGWVQLTSSGSRPLMLNRKTSDGSLIDFYKDSSYFGSIASNAGSNLVVKGAGNYAALLLDNSNRRIEPYLDNATDLGRSIARFKDLYLSGGVYLGGTGSANKLDDYEEGTFAATATPETSGTITLQSTVNTLAYTKIGHLCTVQGLLNVTSVSSPVGDAITIATLPFAAADLTEYAGRAVASVAFRDNSTSTWSITTPVGSQGSQSKPSRR